MQRRLRRYETFNEWKNVEYFGDWSKRSRIMSEMIINSCKSLLDLGCGEMHIKKYISNDVVYFGCDYKKRDDKTIICDLAKGEFPEVKVDTIFMAGVLEYLNNWKDVLENMTKYSKQILLSYSISELTPVRSELWVNNITEAEIIDTITKHGFILADARQVTENSRAYSFIREISK